MKNIKPIVIILFGLFIVSRAQTNTAWGIKAGLVNANQTWDYDYRRTPEYDSRLGLSLSFFGELQKNKYFALCAELSYHQFGIRDDDIEVVVAANNPQGYESQGKLNYRFDYGALTLLAKLKSTTKPTRAYLLAGPKLHYLFSGNDQVDLIIDDLYGDGLAVTAGAGVERDLYKSLKILAEIRYSHDITDLSPSGSLTIKNHYFEFLTGIIF